MAMIFHSSQASSCGTTRALLALTTCLMWVAAPARADVWAQSRAAYAALNSYADRGSVETLYRSGAGPTLTEQHVFTTSYQAPRRFRLDFKSGSAGAGERFVIWSEGEVFNTWWSTTKVASAFPRGQGTMAFAIGSSPTKGAATVIPPLIFAKSGLQGPLSNLTLTVQPALDSVAGHPCYQLRGTESQLYGSGRTTNVRPVTLWIDRDSLLVRKVFEDTPESLGSATVSQIITTIDPQGNPSLEAASFHFEPPAQ
jgi:hypothetical protein